MVKKIYEKGLSLLKLDKKSISSVHSEKEKLPIAFGLFFLPSVINLVLTSLSYPSGFGSIFSSFVFWASLLPGMAIIGMVFFMSFFAEKVYKIKAQYLKDFNTLSFAAIILLVHSVFLLLALIGITFGGLTQLILLAASVWFLVVAKTMFMEIYKMKEQDAIVTVVVGFVAFYLIQEILGRLLIGKFYSFF